MTQNNETSNIVDTLQGLAAESKEDYNLNLVKEIIECEAKFADQSSEDQRALAKQDIRDLVEARIDD